MSNDSLLTVDMVASRLRVPASWIYGKVHSHSLPFPYLKVGKHLRFSAAEVESYLRSVTHRPRVDQDGDAAPAGKAAANA